MRHSFNKKGQGEQMFREQRNLKFHEHCLWAFPSLSLVVKMTLRKTNRATCTREHTHVVHVSSLISTCARPMCMSLCGAQVSLCARQTNLTGNFICFGPGGECGRRGPWHPCAAALQNFSDSQVIFGDTQNSLPVGWRVGRADAVDLLNCAGGMRSCQQLWENLAAARGGNNEISYVYFSSCFCSRYSSCLFMPHFFRLLLTDGGAAPWNKKQFDKLDDFILSRGANLFAAAVATDC